MNRPIESDYKSHVAYTRALEGYSSQLEQAARQALGFIVYHSKWWNGVGEHPQTIVTNLQNVLKETT